MPTIVTKANGVHLNGHRSSVGDLLNKSRILFDRFKLNNKNLTLEGVKVKEVVMGETQPTITLQVPITLDPTIPNNRIRTMLGAIRKGLVNGDTNVVIRFELNPYIPVSQTSADEDYLKLQSK